jgi:hypothetical protein
MIFQDNPPDQEITGLLDQSIKDSDRTYRFLSQLDFDTHKNGIENYSLMESHCQSGDTVVVVQTELSTRQTDAIEYFLTAGYHDICWLIPGIVEGFDNTVFYGWHIEKTVDLYRRLPIKLSTLTPYQVKPKLFDVLLGTQKIHRDTIYQNLVNTGLDNLSIIKYHGLHQVDCTNPDHFFLESGTTLPDNLTITSSGYAEYYGIPTRLSHIIPIEIYNQTAYSVVSETYFDSGNQKNNYSFFTEKIAKPILARRLFVVFSGVRYLKNLRSLGFKTFGDIIDESYDNIENNEERWRCAFDQLVRLSTMNQLEIYDQIQERCDYNFELCMNLDKKFLADLTQYLIK